MKNIQLYLLLIVSFYLSINAVAQDCNITSKANDILPDKLCAPVSLTWEVTYRGVNDAGASVEIQADWDDGNAVEVQTATNTDASTKEWKVTFSHVYPIGGDKCNYQPEAMLIVDGVLCTSSIQVQNVTVWDTDNYNGGIMEIDPLVFPICVGHEDGTFFNDVSTWNCTPAGGENDNINGKTRWTQWVYGTDYTIDNVEVDNTVRSYPYYGSVVEATEYVDAPQPPNNVSLFCNSPITAQVGEYFEVTLRNWNYCNPYDDPNIAGPPDDTINGDFPPVETTARILIVDTPQTNVDPAGPFCANHSKVWLHGSPSGGVWSGTGVNSSGRFNPSVAGSGEHVITYTTTDPVYGCDGTDTIHILIYAVPTVDILPGATAEVCPGDVLHLDGNPTAGDGAIVSHLWTGDTNPLDFTDIQKPSFMTNTQGVYDLIYTVTDDNNCAVSAPISVNVNPVNANILPRPAEACVGADLTLDGNPSGGTGNYVTHTWSGDISYLNVSDAQVVIFNSSTAGTYHFTYKVIDDNDCSGEDTITVTVFDNPIADAGLDDSICGLSVQLQAVPSLGDGSWSKYTGSATLTFADSTNPTTQVTADQYGLCRLIWTENYGPSCIDKDTVEVRFTEQPIANAGPDGGICGYTYQLNATPSIGKGSWSVLSGVGVLTFDNNTQSNTFVTSDVYGDYTLIWHEDNGYGCTDEDTVVVSFNEVPVPAFNPVKPDGCTPFTVNFDNQSVGGNSYFWDFGNGNTSTEKNPIETFYNSNEEDTIYTVTLIVNNPGCGDTLQQTVKVHPLPHANFSHDGTPQCSPLTVDFVSHSTGAVNNVWDFGDGTPLDTADNITHTFINDTAFLITYEVNLIAVTAYSCTDTATDYITVYPNPEYEIEATPDTSCHPAKVEFSTQPTGKTYAWDFGNGTSEIGSYLAESQYVNLSNHDSVYNIQLIVTSYFGCSDTAYKQILIHPSPNVDFNIEETSGCAPFNAQFENTSTGANTFFWDFGDGIQDSILDTDVEHIYQNNTSNPITYYINLKAWNNYGCEDASLKTILVYPKIQADFISDSAGCSPLSVNFINQSYGASSYLWSFGDDLSSTETSPSFIFSNNSFENDTVSVQLIARSNYSCTDTIEKQIVIYATPIALFSVEPNEQIYPETTFSLSNQTEGNHWQYHWNFGDGNSSELEEPSVHSYDTWGNYDIWLKVYSEYCSDSTMQQVKIIAPLPTANFSFEPESGCVPLRISIKNLSINADNYFWDFGDGYTSEAVNPVHVYYDEGLYYIELTASNDNGSNKITLGPIQVYPSPEAHFEVAPDVVFIPEQPIKCYNLTVGADSLWWNFGDRTTSSEENPLHYYTEEGFFTITLIAVSEYLCADTFVIEQAVEVRSEGKIDFPNAFKPNASGSNGGKYPFPDTENYVFHPVFKGVEEYELNIFNRWGELIFVSKDINIGWDGYYRGELCKQDVYVWKVQGKYLDGRQFTLAGDVTLLR